MVCLVIRDENKKFRALAVNQAGVSLRAIFVQGEQLETKLSREKWLDLLPDSGLQPNCNRNGFNIKKAGSSHIIVRFGIIGNNEDNCNSPDSALGIGIGLSNSDVRAGNVNHNSGSISATAYLFVK